MAAGEQKPVAADGQEPVAADGQEPVAADGQGPVAADGQEPGAAAGDGVETLTAAAKASNGATPVSEKPNAAADGGEGGERNFANQTREEEGDEDEDDTSLSLAAMEMALLPLILVILDTIAETYRKLSRVQDKRLTLLQKGEQVPRQTERRYEKLKIELVETMEDVRFNNARIEQLVDQLYSLNRRLVTLEGKLMRYAVRCGVARVEFLKYHYGR